MKNKILGIFVCMLLIAATVFTVVVTTDVSATCPEGMISYWKFDEGSGTVTYDSVDANNGAIYGATWTSGQVDGALSFDGVDDYVEIPHSESLRITGNITVETWFKTTDVEGAMLNRLEKGGVNEWGIYVEGVTQRLRVVRYYGPGIYDCKWVEASQSSVSDGQWHHTAMVDDGTNLILYLDGLKIGEIDTTGLTPYTAVQVARMGHRKGAPQVEYFDGILDEIKVYNYARTAEQIAQDASGLVGYWKFDEGSGSTAIDSSGQGNDGTIYGGATYVDGISRKALSFDGTDDYTSMGDVLDTVFIGTYAVFTVSAWIKPDSVTGEHYIVSKYDDTGSICCGDHNRQWYTQIEDQNLNLRAYEDLDDTINVLEYRTNDSVVSVGNWYYVVFIFDIGNDIYKIYVNGVEKAGSFLYVTSITDIADGSAPLEIGAVCSGNGNLFNGPIDEVAIYYRALSASEILYHYCLGYNFDKSLEYTGAPQPTTSVTLEATLSDSTGAGMPGYDVDFYLDSTNVGTATTDENGVASLNMGSYDVGVYEVYASVYCLGSELAFVAVYDPTEGFVTGGGWIDSPAGAYIPDPILTGKANFGFVSKYKKGQQNLTGNTEFQFKVADLNFHSDSYDWLVIAGAKAMYKGTGTINNEGNYGFMISAIDEKLTPSTDVDLFRIKIWDKDDNDIAVYDNQLGDPEGGDPTTAIGGGQIIIHKN